MKLLEFARCITSTRIDRRVLTQRHVPKSMSRICGLLCLLGPLLGALVSPLILIIILCPI